MSGVRSNPPTRRSSNRPRCAATRWSRRWPNWRAITFNCAARRRRSPSPTRIWLSRERSRKSRRSGKGRASPPASTRKPRPRRPKAFPRAFRRCGRMNRNIRTRSAFCWTSPPARCKGSSGRASARWRRRRAVARRPLGVGAPASRHPRRRGAAARRDRRHRRRRRGLLSDDQAQRRRQPRRARRQESVQGQFAAIQRRPQRLAADLRRRAAEKHAGAAQGGAAGGRHRLAQDRAAGLARSRRRADRLSPRSGAPRGTEAGTGPLAPGARYRALALQDRRRPIFGCARRRAELISRRRRTSKPARPMSRSISSRSTRRWAADGRRLFRTGRWSRSPWRICRFRRPLPADGERF